MQSNKGPKLAHDENKHAAEEHEDKLIRLLNSERFKKLEAQGFIQLIVPTYGTPVHFDASDPLQKEFLTILDEFSEFLIQQGKDKPSDALGSTPENARPNKAAGWMLLAKKKNDGAYEYYTLHRGVLNDPTVELKPLPLKLDKDFKREPGHVWMCIMKQFPNAQSNLPTPYNPKNVHIETRIYINSTCGHPSLVQEPREKYAHVLFAGELHNVDGKTASESKVVNDFTGGFHNVLKITSFDNNKYASKKNLIGSVLSKAVFPDGVFKNYEKVMEEKAAASKKVEELQKSKSLSDLPIVDLSIGDKKNANGKRSSSQSTSFSSFFAREEGKQEIESKVDEENSKRSRLDL